MEIDDIYAVRLQRFRTLMDDRFGGKQAAIATAVGKPANYISRIISGNKKLGEEIVREFETSLDLPAYWFDGLTNTTAWPFPSVSQAAYESLTPEQRRGIEQWVARQVEAFGDTHTPGAGNTKKSA